MINISATGIDKDSKTRIEINIYISSPYWTIEGEEASCDVKILPLYESLLPINGVDPLQALKLAVELSDKLIISISSKYDLEYH